MGEINIAVMHVMYAEGKEHTGRVVVLITHVVNRYLNDVLQCRNHDINVNLSTEAIHTGSGAC